MRYILCADIDEKESFLNDHTLLFSSVLWYSLDVMQTCHHTILSGTFFTIVFKLCVTFFTFSYVNSIKYEFFLFTLKH